MDIMSFSPFILADQTTVSHITRLTSPVQHESCLTSLSMDNQSHQLAGVIHILLSMFPRLGKNFFKIFLFIFLTQLKGILYYRKEIKIQEVPARSSHCSKHKPTTPTPEILSRTNYIAPGAILGKNPSNTSLCPKMLNLQLLIVHAYLVLRMVLARISRNFFD